MLFYLTCCVVNALLTAALAAAQKRTLLWAVYGFAWPVIVPIILIGFRPRRSRTVVVEPTSTWWCSCPHHQPLFDADLADSTACVVGDIDITTGIECALVADD